MKNWPETTGAMLGLALSCDNSSIRTGTGDSWRERRSFAHGDRKARAKRRAAKAARRRNRR
jgi:hypothetical protein